MILLAAVLLTGCSLLSNTSPRVVIDDLQNSVNLPARVQSIVSLAPSNTEILFAVGCGDHLVARDEFSDFPPEALDLPTIGGSWNGYDEEAIVALQPDVVLASQLNTPEQVQSLQALGLTVYYLENPADLEELYDNLLKVAVICGTTSQAEELVDSLRERVTAVTIAIAPISYAPSVFYELDGSDPAKPWTTGPDTFIAYHIRQAGGFNVGDALSTDYAQISLEELLVQNPAIIVLGDSAYGVTPGQVAARPGWEGMSAVQNEMVFPFDDDLVSIPGPRLVDGLEELARLLHPGVFE